MRLGGLKQPQAFVLADTRLYSLLFTVRHDGPDVSHTVLIYTHGRIADCRRCIDVLCILFFIPPYCHMIS